MDHAAFVRDNARLMAAGHVPEIVLHLADEALPLWEKTETDLRTIGLPPPYWAFAWAGGQALARHVLDRPELVARRRVLDLGSGSGLVAIAAAMAGAASVRANEIDPFALAAIAMNAAANGVMLDVAAGDLLDGDCDADVVLVGDLFYERPLAEKVLAFIRRADALGADVLIGDPRRNYLPAEALVAVATYEIAVPRTLEDSEVKSTTVWRLG